MKTAPETAPVQRIEDVIFNAPVGTEFCCTDECQAGHSVRVPVGGNGWTVESDGFRIFKIAEAGRVVDGEKVVTITTSRGQTCEVKLSDGRRKLGPCEVKFSDFSSSGDWKINERKGLPLSKDRAAALYDLSSPLRFRRSDPTSEIRGLMVAAGLVLGEKK